MNKLKLHTLEQKLAIYQLVCVKMMERFSLGECINGFCFLMDVCMCKFYDEWCDSYLRIHAPFSQWDAIEGSPFPELLRYKPSQLVFSNGDPDGRFWFPTNDEGYYIRLHIINQVIAEVEYAIKVQK